MPAHQPRLSFTETEDGEAETDLCRAACYRWRTASELPGLLAALTEPPYADPHVRWCGRGGRVTAPPMPICGCQETMRNMGGETWGKHGDGSNVPESGRGMGIRFLPPPVFPLEHIFRK